MQRQGRPLTRVLPALVVAALMLAGGGAVASAEDAPSARERLLRDEQRQLDGRIQTLDRELAPYDRDRLRSPSPGDRWAPGAGSDPAAERRDLERRNLHANERAIEDRLRQRR